MSVQCSARVEVEAAGETLHAESVKRWLDHVPDGAALTPLLREVGSQRDPETKLVGLVASWSEAR